MTGNRTFSMIKPHAVAANYTGAMLARIEAAGYRIVAMKKTRLSAERAADFYAVHKGKPFFESLLGVMSEGPIYAFIVEKENAVADFRTFIGATDPAKADEGTIRKEFGFHLEHNSIHGSDSDENAQIESAFFFSTLELF